jgi:hypothetical protein
MQGSSALAQAFWARLPFSSGHPAIITQTLQRSLKWDPAKEKFLGDPPLSRGPRLDRGGGRGREPTLLLRDAHTVADMMRRRDQRKPQITQIWSIANLRPSVVIGPKIHSTFCLTQAERAPIYNSNLSPDLSGGGH